MGSKRGRRAKVITRSITKRKRGRPSKDTADFRVQSIADNWDFKKTVKENYANLGLVSDVNAIAPRAPVILEVADVPRVEPTGIIAKELKAIEESNDIPRQPEVKYVSLLEQRVLLKLIQKHGDNVDAMSKDLKLNINQNTSNQLKKKIDNYNKLRSL